MHTNIQTHIQTYMAHDLWFMKTPSLHCHYSKNLQKADINALYSESEYFIAF